jgi:hypothetical protein
MGLEFHDLLLELWTVFDDFIFHVYSAAFVRLAKESRSASSLSQNFFR